MKVTLVLAAIGAAVITPVAQAKFVPTLDRHVAAPGATIHGSLGIGAEFIAWPSPIEISLARSDLAASIVSRRDARLIRVKTVRPHSGFIANRFSFVFAYNNAELSSRMALRVLTR
jgi:hypothetical protein